MTTLPKESKKLSGMACDSHVTKDVGHSLMHRDEWAHQSPSVWNRETRKAEASATRADAEQSGHAGV